MEVVRCSQNVDYSGRNPIAGNNLKDWDINDRLLWCTVLVVISFACLFVLGSQSAASYGTYALGVLVLATNSRWRDVWGLDLIWLVVALLGYLTLSSFWSEEVRPREIFSIAVRAVLTFTFVIAVAETQLRGRTQRWLGFALSAVGFATVIGAFYFYVIEPPWDGRLVGRGQLDNNVVAGLIFAVAAVFSLRLAWSEEQLGWRVFGSMACAALITGVAYTGSRNAMMGLFCGVIVYTTARLVTTPQRFFAVLLPAAIIAVVALYVLAFSDFAEQLFPRGDSFRFSIWQAAWKEVAESSLLWGKGILTSDDLVVDGVQFEHPHSMYMSVVYQGGIIALGLLTLLVVRAISLLLTRFSDPDAKFALAVLAISLPVYLFDEHELLDKVGTTWVLFWMPVACALGVQWRPQPSDTDQLD